MGKEETVAVLKSVTGTSKQTITPTTKVKIKIPELKKNKQVILVRSGMVVKKASASSAVACDGYLQIDNHYSKSPTIPKYESLNTTKQNRQVLLLLSVKWECASLLRFASKVYLQKDYRSKQNSNKY